MDESAEELIGLLQQQAELQSSGTFTLDLQAAQSRVQSHLTSDRNAYLTRMARAAVTSGAAYLHCQTTRGQLLAHSPALLGNFHNLEDLLNQAVRSHPLAQAALLALGLEPTEMELTLAGTEVVTRLFHRSGRSEVSKLPPGLLCGTYLRLQLAQPQGYTGAIQRLQERLRYAPIPIYVNRKLIQRDSSKAPSPGPLEVARDEDLTGFCGRSGQAPKFYWNDHQILQWRLRDRLEEDNQLGLIAPTAASIVLQEAAHEYPPGLLLCSAYLALYCGRQGRTLSLVHSGEVIQASPLEQLLPTAEAVVDASHLALDLTGERVLEEESLVQWIQSRASHLTSFLQTRYPLAIDSDYRASLLFDRGWHGIHPFDP
jgi:hypothetical protein